MVQGFSDVPKAKVRYVVTQNGKNITYKDIYPKTASSNSDSNLILVRRDNGEWFWVNPTTSSVVYEYDPVTKVTKNLAPPVQQKITGVTPTGRQIMAKGFTDVPKAKVSYVTKNGNTISYKPEPNLILVKRDDNRWFWLDPVTSSVVYEYDPVTKVTKNLAPPVQQKATGTTVQQKAPVQQKATGVTPTVQQKATTPIRATVQQNFTPTRTTVQQKATGVTRKLTPAEQQRATGGTRNYTPTDTRKLTPAEQQRAAEVAKNPNPTVRATVQQNFTPTVQQNFTPTVQQKATAPVQQKDTAPVQQKATTPTVQQKGTYLDWLL
ncbi:MAG: hypothetical protein Nk1A_9000 [Endomicrobiia bacterium]|nr:MAG: hypothetical protein Nk1A_9000 [Endomicrobiia bacterium]